jgi:hypothetical protein
MLIGAIELFIILGQFQDMQRFCSFAGQCFLTLQTRRVFINASTAVVESENTCFNRDSIDVVHMLEGRAFSIDTPIKIRDIQMVSQYDWLITETESGQ